MAMSSSHDNKYAVYLQKNCYVGPFLDPSKVKRLPDFFKERNVCETVKSVLEALISTGFCEKDVFDQIPSLNIRGEFMGVHFEVVKEGNVKGKGKPLQCKLPIIDRRSKGDTLLERFVENLHCCPGLLSQTKEKCKCSRRNDSKELNLKPPKVEPTVEINQTSDGPKIKNSFTMYCRRKCMTGLLLDPEKVEKLPASFSGSFPNVVKEFVPAIVLCGFNPLAILKKVPSMQNGCTLIEVRIGRVKRMCLVGKVDYSVPFWRFIKKLLSVLGICENFLSDQLPENLFCEECRTHNEAGYSSSGDEFQELKAFKRITRSNKRK